MSRHILLQCLHNLGLYESREEAVLREEVLGRLDKLAKIWVQRVSALYGMSDIGDIEANAKIFTFGSYSLGVHGPGTRLHLSCIRYAWNFDREHDAVNI